MTQLIIVDADRQEDRTYVRVPIVKASSKEVPGFVDVCIDELPDDVYKEVLIQGLKTLLNRGMSKITGTKTDASRKQAFEVAKENLQAAKENKVRLSKGVRSKGTGAGPIKTVAMGLARAVVKQAMKDAGLKVSHYTAKQISALAEEYLEGEQGEVLLAQAKETIEKRAEEAKKATASINLKGLKADPELVAKANAKKKPKAEKGTVAQAQAALQAKGRPAAHVQH